MVKIQRTHYCKSCGMDTLHQRNAFSLLLTVMTGGLILLIWLAGFFVGIFRPSRLKCTACGTEH